MIRFAEYCLRSHGDETVILMILEKLLDLKQSGLEELLTLVVTEFPNIFCKLPSSLRDRVALKFPEVFDFFVPGRGLTLANFVIVPSGYWALVSVQV
jgi:hypothetical protein